MNKPLDVIVEQDSSLEESIEKTSAEFTAPTAVSTNLRAPAIPPKNRAPAMLRGCTQAVPGNEDKEFAADVRFRQTIGRLKRTRACFFGDVEDPCCICIEPLKKKKAFVTLKCGHTLCDDCFPQVDKCPLDRKPIVKGEAKYTPICGPTLDQDYVSQLKEIVASVVKPFKQQDNVHLLVRAEFGTSYSQNYQPTVLSLEKKPIEGEASKVPGNKLILLDNSGSTRPFYPLPAEETKTTISSFVGDTLTVVVFNSYANVLIPPTVVTQDNCQSLVDKLLTVYATGGTDLPRGLKLCREMVPQILACNSASPIELFVITDGQTERIDLATTLFANCVSDGIKCQLRGTGPYYDYNMCSDIVGDVTMFEEDTDLKSSLKGVMGTTTGLVIDISGEGQLAYNGKVRNLPAKVFMTKPNMKLCFTLGIPSDIKVDGTQLLPKYNPRLSFEAKSNLLEQLFLDKLQRISINVLQEKSAEVSFLLDQLKNLAKRYKMPTRMVEQMEALRLKYQEEADEYLKMLNDSSNYGGPPSMLRVSSSQTARELSGLSQAY